MKQKTCCATSISGSKTFGLLQTGIRGQGLASPFPETELIEQGQPGQLAGMGAGLAGREQRDLEADLSSADVFSHGVRTRVNWTYPPALTPACRFLRFAKAWRFSMNFLP